MSSRRPPLHVSNAVRRCAIYTRKSSEEGLEQAFNSLDAQREACEAYVSSQQHEGWVALPTLYDDGGISGGTMDRPALQQLLIDIAAGRVDLVVVYKVDRLTRSLSDFAKIVDVFDGNGISFVSITQQFNTTTSMGRLTLNMLLSFAQFEREVTGERIRDKIAASKRKGMWMGGIIPLGYDVIDRRLAVNAAEAQTVQHIFRTYLELGSVRLLREQLAVERVRSKLRSESKEGQGRGGRALQRGALYLMLQNPLYRGQVRHQGNSYAGEHEAIVDQKMWDDVQAMLDRNRVEQRLGVRAERPSLLAGLVYDQYGERLVPTHASKGNRRYRYYVSKPLLTNCVRATADGLRVPATDLERIVTDRLLQFLRQKQEVFAAIRLQVTDGKLQRQMLEEAAAIEARWAEQSSSDHRNLLQRLLGRIAVHPDAVTLHLIPQRLAAHLATTLPFEPHGQVEPVLLTVPVRLTRTKHEMRLLIQGSTEMKPDVTLIRLIAKAHRLRDRLYAGDQQLGEIAAQHGLSSSYFTRVMRNAFLAPDIVTAIISGRQPVTLVASKLMTDSRLPLSWAEQRRVLGFNQPA